MKSNLGFLLSMGQSNKGDPFQVLQDWKEDNTHTVKSTLSDAMNDTPPKIIAIVFPQFHAIPENDEAWGEGFTEWTLLRHIEPCVNGLLTRQPHPDIDYYNLLDKRHRQYMRVLANQFHIHGFCFYHYWFKGSKLMYLPVELMMSDGEPNKPFFFCWANESWTRNWDGSERNVIIKQEYGDERDILAHFNYLVRFFKHKNYMRINNRPIFVFYRIEEHDAPAIQHMMNKWQEYAEKAGMSGIHFLRFLGPFNNDVSLNGMHGVVEFQPGYSMSQFDDIRVGGGESIFEDGYNEQVYLANNPDVLNAIKMGVLQSGKDHHDVISERERRYRTSKYKVYDGATAHDKLVSLPRKHEEVHRGTFTTWSNVPRRNKKNTNYCLYPHMFVNNSITEFEPHIGKLIKKVIDDPNKTDNLIFVTAWNEWNEQAVLEPSNIDGYSYLMALRRAYLKHFPVCHGRVVHVSHRGGGTEKYVNDLKTLFPAYQHVLAQERADLPLFDQDVKLLHVHSAMVTSMKWDVLDVMKRYKDRGIPVYLTVHDYQWLHPSRPNITMELFNKPKPHIQNRTKTLELFALADKVIMPDRRVYDNYRLALGYYSDVNVHIVPHCDVMVRHQQLYINPIIDSQINIAYVGHFCAYKGAQEFCELAKKYVFAKGHDIQYHVYGSIDYDSDIPSHVIMHGPYSDHNISKRLRDEGVHIVVHLSVFEETYCYSLSRTINSGLPIVYLNRGSFLSRCKTDCPRFFKVDNTEDLVEALHDAICFVEANQCCQDIVDIDDQLQPNRWYLENYLCS
jgi:hypothetical protein